MPAILERLVRQLKAKGVSKNKAHAVAVSQLQRAGIIKKGTLELTAKGKKRQALGPAGRAKSRAAKKNKGRKPSDYKYNKKTNRATLKKGRKKRKKKKGRKKRKKK
jgi:hypothetical protein|tara:strand:+ start:1688 stop:2005 length:318 start_codon:yes stop_codon:yes gene_type:complete